MHFTSTIVQAHQSVLWSIPTALYLNLKLSHVNCRQELTPLGKGHKMAGSYSGDLFNVLKCAVVETFAAKTVL